jgi:hypothetical protein
MLTRALRAVAFLAEGGARRAAQPRARDMTASIWTRDEGGGGAGGAGGDYAPAERGYGHASPAHAHGGGAGFAPPAWRGGSGGSRDGGSGGRDASRHALLPPRARQDPCLAEATAFMHRRGGAREESAGGGGSGDDDASERQPRWGAKRLRTALGARDAPPLGLDAACEGRAARAAQQPQRGASATALPPLALPLAPPASPPADALPSAQVDSAPTSDNEHDASAAAASADAACAADAPDAPAALPPVTASPVALRELELAGEGTLLDFPWDPSGLGDEGACGWEGMSSFASELASGALLGHAAVPAADVAVAAEAR